LPQLSHTPFSLKCHISTAFEVKINLSTQKKILPPIRFARIVAPTPVSPPKKICYSIL